ncbi:MAG: hypothetical protein WAP03_21660 [Methylorubrum rhodinum]|uniref:hypothetical protein n=1 Tax=Methylorubrum rhodinum TaxID=29428 RepID=UPI003BAF21D3
MIPLNAREANDLLRHRAREIAQSERQVRHFEALAANERSRLARLRAERAALEELPARLSTPPTESPQP